MKIDKICLHLSIDTDSCQLGNISLGGICASYLRLSKVEYGARVMICYHLCSSFFPASFIETRNSIDNGGKKIASDT
jgi:hypothetical protein